MEVLQYIVYGLYLLTVIGIILVVISENRSPIRSLAWVLVLVFIPAIGVVLFYFFGQNNRKIRRISSRYKNWEDKELFLQLVEEHHNNAPVKFLLLSRLLSQVNGSILLRGSKVEVFTEGERKFSTLLEDIRQAKKHIHMEYFIFCNDTTGKELKEALMQKAELLTKYT